MSILLSIQVIFVCLYLVLLESLALSIPRRVSFVTGASGYVGKEIVLALLNADDYGKETKQEQHVVCCVRPTSVDSMKEYWKDEPRVSVQPYDMLDGGVSLEKAISSTPTTAVIDSEGAGASASASVATSTARQPVERCVFHVASVFGPTEDHKQTALDNVRGTTDVIKVVAGANKENSNINTKVVITSSMAAVRATGQIPKNGRVYTHEDWNSGSELGVNWGNSYQWSKAESERQAWELSKELGVSMTSLCPAFVFGPSCDGSFDSNSYSITLVRQWMKGESEVQSRLCVDVRDLARAHVAAGTNPGAVGQRFIVSAERRLTSERTAEALKTCSKNPERITYDQNFDGGAIKIGEQEVECVERLKEELGIDLTPIDQTFRDMAEGLSNEQD